MVTSDPELKRNAMAAASASVCAHQIDDPEENASLQMSNSKGPATCHYYWKCVRNEFLSAMTSNQQSEGSMALYPSLMN